jgi:hypothetical protein
MTPEARAPVSHDRAPDLVDGTGETRHHPNRIRWATVGIILVLGVAYLLPLRALFRAPGAAMEEGFMLVFPDRFLHGDVPNRDYLNLYGPGSIWVLAGVYKLFGTQVVVERTVGLVQLVGTTTAMVLLTRWWGRWVALSAGILSVLFGMPAVGLIAIPWSGGVALALGGLVALATARERARSSRSGRVSAWALAGGLLSAVALLYRLDLVLAMALGATVLLWRAGRTVVGRFAVGFAIGVVPYLVHLAMAGPANVWNGMIVEPMLYLRATRHLDVPPDPGHLVGVARVIVAIDRPWPLPRLTAAQQLTAWFVLLVAATVAVVVVAALAMHRDRVALRPRLLLAAGMFAAGLLPQAVQRADSAHLGWVSAVTIGLVPAAAVELAAGWRPRWRPARVGLTAAAVTLLFVIVLVPTYVARRYVSLVQDSVDDKVLSTGVTHDGRTFLVGADPSLVRSIDELLRGVDAVARPGDRVIVATGDLRRTPYIDSFLYHLLPKYRPGTTFIEMEPGITNRDGTPLTDELRKADVVIVSDRWKGWDEPNDSMKPGDPRPAEVFRRRFCRVGDYGNGYSLFTPCLAVDGSSP